MMNEPSGANAPAAARPSNPHRVSLVLAMHLAMLGVLIVSVTFALSAYWPLPASIAVAVVLSSIFATLIEATTDSEMAPLARIACAVLASLMGIVTVSLTYSTWYGKLFAEGSALQGFAAQHRAVLPALDAALNEARAAQTAFASWATDAADKAAKEATVGGTCAARAQSDGRRGPITMFREAEAGIATALQKEFSTRVQALAQAADKVRLARPTTYGAMVNDLASLNAALDQARALTSGSSASAARDTIQRQAAVTITWRGQVPFTCGDRARDETLARALKALEALGKVSVPPPQQVVIDLSDQREVVGAGLLRGANLPLWMMSLGHAGHLDTLLKDALRTHGPINRETIGFGLAALIELLLAVTAVLARRAGHTGAVVDPQGWLSFVDDATMSWPPARRGHARFLAKAVTCVLGWLLLVPVQPAQSVGETSATTAGIPPSQQAVDWAMELLPWMYEVGDAAYAVVPQTVRARRPNTAARALVHAGWAQLVAEECPWASLASSRAQVARQLVRLLPDATQLVYGVYRFEPALAQTLRAQLLEAA